MGLGPSPIGLVIYCGFAMLVRVWLCSALLAWGHNVANLLSLEPKWFSFSFLANHLGQNMSRFCFSLRSISNLFESHRMEIVDFHSC